MTKEQKELLLKDLCARLPYGVILNCCGIVSEPLTLISYKGLVNNDYDIDEVKPYLFPLSSMTIDDFNNKTKSLKKVVYEGWVVRNVYKHTGNVYSINFFESYPSKCERDNKSQIIWADINGNRIPKMEIKTKKLFGKECLEPMRLIITIEQIED